MPSKQDKLAALYDRYERVQGGEYGAEMKKQIERLERQRLQHDRIIQQMPESMDMGSKGALRGQDGWYGSSKALYEGGTQPNYNLKELKRGATHALTEDFFTASGLQSDQINGILQRGVVSALTDLQLDVLMYNSKPSNLIQLGIKLPVPGAYDFVGSLVPVANVIYMRQHDGPGQSMGAWSKLISKGNLSKARKHCCRDNQAPTDALQQWENFVKVFADRKFNCSDKSTYQAVCNLNVPSKAAAMTGFLGAASAKGQNMPRLQDADKLMLGQQRQLKGSAIGAAAREPASFLRGQSFKDRGGSLPTRAVSGKCDIGINAEGDDDMYVTYPRIGRVTKKSGIQCAPRNTATIGLGPNKGWGRQIAAQKKNPEAAARITAVRDQYQTGQQTTSRCKPAGMALRTTTKVAELAYFKGMPITQDLLQRVFQAVLVAHVWLSKNALTHADEEEPVQYQSSKAKIVFGGQDAVVQIPTIQYGASYTVQPGFNRKTGANTFKKVSSQNGQAIINGINIGAFPAQQLKERFQAIGVPFVLEFFFPRPKSDVTGAIYDALTAGAGVAAMAAPALLPRVARQATQLQIEDKIQGARYQDGQGMLGLLRRDPQPGVFDQVQIAQGPQGGFQGGAAGELSPDMMERDDDTYLEI